MIRKTQEKMKKNKGKKIPPMSATFPPVLSSSARIYESPFSPPRLYGTKLHLNGRGLRNN